MPGDRDRDRWRARIVDLEIAHDRTWGPRADLRGLGAIARGLMRLDVDPLIAALAMRADVIDEVKAGTLGDLFECV